MITTIDEIIYAFICDYLDEHGYPPSLDEVARQLEMGKTTAYYHVNQLCKAGRLRKTPGVARSLVVVR